MTADQDGWNTDFRDAPRDGTVIEVLTNTPRTTTSGEIVYLYWDDSSDYPDEWEGYSVKYCETFSECEFVGWRPASILPRGTEASHD